MPRFLSSWILPILCLALAACASPKALPLEAGPPTDAPGGYVDFCKRAPVHYACGSSIEDISWHLQTRGQTLFDYVPDLDRFQRFEHWESFFHAYARGERFAGDCDDYTLTLMDAARHVGVPLSKIALVFCETEDGTLHLVLMLDGKWILDNRQSRPLQRVQLPRYTWLKFMTINRPNEWNTFAPSMVASQKG